MLKNRKLTSLVAVLLSALMLMSLLTVSAFADTDTAESVTEDTTVTEATSEAESGSATTAESGSETTVETATGTETETTAGTEGDKTDMTRTIVNLSVGGLILALVIVLVVKFRSKIPAWWKALKSECGKIVWCPKDKLKKNTIVVIIIIVILAVLIGVLDYAFSRGVSLLRDIVHKG